MNLFIITPVFPPEPVTNASTSADIADEMTKRGHQVTVFTAFPNRPSGKVHEGYSRAWRSTESRKGYKVVRCWHTLSKKSTLSSRALENMSFGLTSTFHMLREKKPDLVYMDTWALLAQNMNSLLLKMRRVPIVCCVQDIYPESLVDKGILKEGGWPARLIRFADLLHLRRCRVVTSISPGMVRQLVTHRSLDKGKVLLIPNWMDASSFRPLPSSRPDHDIRRSLGIPHDTFLAVFAGSITQAAGAELYVRAAEKLRGRKDVMILLAGDGSMRRRLEAEIKSLGLQNIRMLYPLPSDRVHEVQSAGDVLLLSLSGDFSISAMPSKQIAYMLSGRPVVASINRESSAADVIRESESGFILPVGDSAAIAALLAELSQNRSRLERLGANAKRYAEQNFSREALLPRLADLLESAVAPDHTHFEADYGRS